MPRASDSITALTSGRFFLKHAHEFGGGVGQPGSAAGDDVQVARHVQLANLDLLQPAVLNLPRNAHAWHDRHAHTHLHKALDALDGGHFDGHVEGSAVTSEKLNHFAAEGRFDDVGDKGFVA